MHCYFPDTTPTDTIVTIPIPSKTKPRRGLNRTISQLSDISGKILIAVSATFEMLLITELMQSNDEDPYADYHNKITRAIVFPLASVVNIALFTLGTRLGLKPKQHYPRKCEDLHLIFKLAYAIIDEHKNAGSSFFYRDPQVTEACATATEKLESIEHLYYTLSLHACNSPSTRCSTNDSLPYRGYGKVLEQAEEAAKKVIEDLASEINSLLYRNNIALK